MSWFLVAASRVIDFEVVCLAFLHQDFHSERASIVFSHLLGIGRKAGLDEMSFDVVSFVPLVQKFLDFPFCTTWPLKNKAKF